MTGAGWPYLPGQCPHCMYLHATAPFTEDSGYEVVGFCRHPRIAMELFRSRLEPSASERCPGFVRGAGVSEPAESSR
ncbi:MAG: hypothetical protein ACRDL5_08285 [Solirubrobacteraceae bacterium]